MKKFVKISILAITLLAIGTLTIFPLKQSKAVEALPWGKATTEGCTVWLPTIKAEHDAHISYTSAGSSSSITIQVTATPGTKKVCDWWSLDGCSSTEECAVKATTTSPQS